MEFNEFTEIENHYREKYLGILREYGFDKVKWLALEKIHGANFSFITDGKELQVASRKQIVDRTFFRCGEVIDKYGDNVKDLKNIHYPNAKQIQVYGELFGPGMSGKIWYGTEREFMAFDIEVDGVVQNTGDVAGLLAHCKIPKAPTVGLFDSLDDALACDPVFVSKVIDVLYPEHIGVSEYELGENDAEGLVLKPVDPLYLPNDSRVMVKHKHPDFAEKLKRPKSKPSGLPNPWAPVAEQYVNQNRLDAVLSKEGELTNKDFGRIVALMCEDVMKDMIKDEDLSADWKKHNEYKLAGKGVSLAVAKFLKENLLHKL